MAVLSTCADRAEAERIAKALVEERLAACVNIVPGLQSVYRWQGNIEVSEEILLLIKTTAERASALRDRLLALHSYDTPEVLILPIRGGSDAYLRWVQEEVPPAT